MDKNKGRGRFQTAVILLLVCLPTVWILLVLPSSMIAAAQGGGASSIAGTPNYLPAAVQPPNTPTPTLAPVPTSTPTKNIIDQLDAGNWISIGAAVISCLSLIFTVLAAFFNWRLTRQSFLADKMPYIDIEPQQAAGDDLRFQIGNHNRIAEIRDIVVQAWVGRAERRLKDRVLRWIKLDPNRIHNIAAGGFERCSITGKDGALQLLCQHFYPSAAGKDCYTRLVQDTTLRLRIKITYQPAVTGLRRTTFEKTFRIVARKSPGVDEPYLELEEVF